MALKKSKDGAKAKKAKTVEERDDTTTTAAAAAAAAAAQEKKTQDENVSSESDDDSDDDDDDDDDDDLILEGVLIRNPDVSDSDDSSDDDDDDSDDDDHEEDMKPAAAASADKKTTTKKTTTKDSETSSSSSSKTKEPKNNNKTRKRKKPAGGGPDITQVEFTFWDMREHFFHGMKTLLHSSSTVYAAQSSALADLMIENVSVGTILSTEGDTEGNVFGFASVLNVSTYQDHDCIQYLKNTCLDKCPDEHKMELQTVLSGSTKRPAGFLMHGRMINVPLEIVEILHQQLVLDMDWAVKNAEGGEEERKSLDFGAFIRIAPGTKDASSDTTSSSSSSRMLEYKYFDDEIFANNAEFLFTIDAPKTFGSDTKQYCSVIVMTKTGHRDAMKELKRLVGS